MLIDTARIEKGNDFYVYLSLDKGGFAYDRTSEVPVLLGSKSRVVVPSTANLGQSFYFYNDEWLDFYNYNDPSGFQNTGNFCIKAIANHDPITRINNLKNNILNFEISPNPFVNSIILSVYAELPAKAEIQVYSIDGKLIQKVEELNCVKGKNNFDIDLSNNVSGIYFVKLIVDGKSIETKKIIKK